MIRLDDRQQPAPSLRVRLAALVLGTAVVLVTMAATPDHHDPASTDGRYHRCGLVTADGVTDHLTDYHHRCPATTKENQP